MGIDRSFDDAYLRRMRQLIESNRSSQRESSIERESAMIDSMRDAYQAPSPSPNTSHNSKFPQPDLKIEVLTNKNKELTEKYAILLKKTNTIVDSLLLYFFESVFI